MAVCDVLVFAEPGDVVALLASVDPLRGGWSGHRLNQVDANTLSVLGAVLRGDSVPDIDAFDWPRVGAADEDDGPWVYTFPTDLAELLRGQAPPELPARWKEAHDLLEYCDVDVLESELDAIRALVAESERTGTPLLYWSMA